MITIQTSLPSQARIDEVHIKHTSLKRQPSEPWFAVTTKIKEKRNHQKTFETSVKKLEVEIENKDVDIHSLRDCLLDSEQRCRRIDAWPHAY